MLDFLQDFMELLHETVDHRIRTLLMFFAFTHFSFGRGHSSCEIVLIE